MLFVWLFIMSIMSVDVCAQDAPFIKIHASQKNNGSLEDVFVHTFAWFGICDFAYIPNGDPWAPPRGKATPYNPENVPAGSLIFATPHGIERFLEEVHPKIKNPYVLVTLYYGPVCGISKYVNDPKIIAWFGQANRDAITYEKFTLIPLGVLANQELFDQRQKTEALFKKLRNVPKSKWLYMNFTIHQGRFDGRSEVYNLFKDKSFCMASGKKPFLEYMQDAAQARFVLSPTGDMCDCYRHWEALLAGSIPVVHASSLDAIFQDLPVVIVDDYKEVTEEFLYKKYDELKDKKYNFRKLYMQYWVDKINEAKSAFFRV
ncbi:MAG: hypothetical protein P4L31_06060 [Candidatus Babeliales bacterium]|nr:hypothetical protein [Candidatus Babeliales bacterium]